jgi:hypothetical protein
MSIPGTVPSPRRPTRGRVAPGCYRPSDIDRSPRRFGSGRFSGERVLQSIRNTRASRPLGPRQKPAVAGTSRPSVTIAANFAKIAHVTTPITTCPGGICSPQQFSRRIETPLCRTRVGRRGPNSGFDSNANPSTSISCNSPPRCRVRLRAGPRGGNRKGILDPLPRLRSLRVAGPGAFTALLRKGIQECS